MNEDNVIKLPGSEGWENAFTVAKEWAAKFPGQDADEFVYCLEHTEPFLDEGVSITKIQMLEQGERDEASWMWCIWTDKKSSYKGVDTFIVVAGCDYTGWDCQSWSSWSYITR